MMQPESPHVAHTTHTALVVDDEPAVLGVLSQLLTRAGLSVTTATNAEQAFAILSEEVPCVVMADVMMPGTDGFGICRRIKRDPRTAHVPVILVTGRTEEADVDEGVAAGAADYIKKPFDRDEVRMRVRTQIRLHEARLEQQQSEDQHRTIFNTSRDALMTLSPPSWGFTDCNTATLSLFGVASTAAFCSLGPPDVSPERQPDGRLSSEAAGAMIGKALDEGFAHFEWTHRRVDGTPFPADVLLTRMVHDGRPFLQATVRDISDRKRLESELGHARKLEAVGQLAAGIAHEINTPTQYVGDSVLFLQEAFDGVTQVLAQRQRAVDALRALGGHDALVSKIRAVEEEVDLEYFASHVPDSFGRCLDGVGRISTIVRAMKEFAHPDSREKAPADLNQALRSTLVIAANEYKYVADVETDLADLPPVYCYLGDLNQVFLNLIVNAAHAIGDVVANTGTKGRIVVTTRRQGDAVRITVGDTGGGIPASVRDKIFEPFFTTKEVGKGSGQGLPIARSIVVDKHGGALEFTTEVGVGTTFTITLPSGSAGHTSPGAVS